MNHPHGWLLDSEEEPPRIVGELFMHFKFQKTKLKQSS
jgi:hypothetical protein